MSKKPLIKPVIDAIRGRGPLSHSTLYWWMWDHFDDIQPARSGRPDWVTATLEFSNMGFTGRNGEPLSKENVRKTWTRVVRDKMRAQEKAASSPPAAPSEPAVRMFPVSPAKPDTQDKADPQQPTDKPDTLEDFKRGLGSIGKYGGKN